MVTKVDRLVYNRRMIASSRNRPGQRSARERILLTAHDLFYREGIRATGVDRLIAESGVAKLTFYRHFASKNNLVQAYLTHRHDTWMTWFTQTLAQHQPRRGPAWKALPPTLAEWFDQPAFRGCAFINAAVELGAALPEVAVACREHKVAMTGVIATLLPPSRWRQRQAGTVACAVDGAIVRAQLDASGKNAVDALERLLDAVLG